MDLTRLNSANCLEKYVALMGEEYLSRGLDKLYDDFRNSMYAAWTPSELCSAIPAIQTHQWHYFSIFPLPFSQFLFAKPRAWRPHMKANALQWPHSEVPVRPDLKDDYQILIRSIYYSYQWFLKNLD